MNNTAELALPLPLSTGSLVPPAGPPRAVCLRSGILPAPGARARAVGQTAFRLLTEASLSMILLAVAFGVLSR